MMYKSFALLMVCSFVGIGFSAPAPIDVSNGESDVTGMRFMKRGGLSESESSDTVSELRYYSSILGRITGATRSGVDGLLDILGVGNSNGLDTKSVSDILKDPKNLNKIKQIIQELKTSGTLPSGAPFNSQNLVNILRSLKGRVSKS
ncbi:hypothetical protein K7432_003597 [Basidiobolus ranarum]|uniref:Uncharacterized protein n=1 Tax=Basidiobolus ranarum TaxID=34480 RepID=A0ABR2W5W9_9FUNG